MLWSVVGLRTSASLYRASIRKCIDSGRVEHLTNLKCGRLGFEEMLNVLGFAADQLESFAK